jgi:hypothetical protein
MVYRTPYPWYCEFPTHAIANPIPMLFGPPSNGISNPLPVVFWPSYPLYTETSTHSISNPLPTIFWPTYPWYIEPPTQGILNSLLMVYRTPIHGVSNSLPMVYQTPFPWYFEPPTHGILLPLPIYWLEMRGGSKYHEVESTIQGGSVFNKGVQYTMDENWPGVQNTIGHLGRPHAHRITFVNINEPHTKLVA